jgi:hypothetical protein
MTGFSAVGAELLRCVGPAWRAATEGWVWGEEAAHAHGNCGHTKRPAGCIRSQRAFDAETGLKAQPAPEARAAPTTKRQVKKKAPHTARLTSKSDALDSVTIPTYNRERTTPAAAST